MLKFLRKYSKVLLVVVGVFLMIAFLLPSALQELGKGGPSQTVMTIDGRKVSYQESIDAAKQLRTIEVLTMGVFPRGVGIEERGEHWIMAREAAKRGGFYGGAADGPQLISEAVEAGMAARFGPQGMQIIRQNPQFMEQIEKQSKERVEGRAQIGAQAGLNPRDTDLALSAARGVMRMQSLYSSAPRVSENRLIRKAHELIDEAQVQVLFIGIDTVAFIADPPEEALRAHFEMYKDKRAGEGENAFGYLRPRRFKLEFLQLDHDAIASAVKVSAIEIQKRLRDASVMKEETDPAKRRDAIEKAIRAEMVEKVLQEATLAYRTEVVAASNTLAEQGGYRVITPEWAARRPTMTAIAQKIVERVKEQTGVQIPAPKVVSKDKDWVAISDLRQLEGIGRAMVRRGSNRAGLEQLAEQIKELRKPGDSGVREFSLQAGVPFGDPLDSPGPTGEIGSRFFLTVLEAADESPAASLDEVRSQVINDCKRAQEYAKLAEKVASVQAAAVATGLEALAEQQKGGGLSTDLRSGVRVTRQFVSPREAAVNTKAFMDAVGAKMSQLDPAVPLDSLTPDMLYVGVAIPGKLGIAVAKITAFTPATVERFRQAVSFGLGNGQARELIGEEKNDLLAHDRMAKRMKLEIPRSADQLKADQDKADREKADRAKRETESIGK